MEKTWTEEELLNGINELHYPAIKEYHDRIMESLRSFVFYFVRNMTDAERIASEAFTDSLLSNSTFKTLKHAKNYIYKAAKNKSFTFLQSTAGKKRIIISQEFSENIDSDTEGSINKAEIIFEMNEQIKELPPMKKKIIQLILDGKKTSEIAQIIQKSEQYVLNTNRKPSCCYKRNLILNPKLSILILINLMNSFYKNIAWRVYLTIFLVII